MEIILFGTTEQKFRFRGKERGIERIRNYSIGKIGLKTWVTNGPKGPCERLLLLLLFRDNPFLEAIAKDLISRIETLQKKKRAGLESYQQSVVDELIGMELN